EAVFLIGLARAGEALAAVEVVDEVPGAPAAGLDRVEARDLGPEGDVLAAGEGLELGEGEDVVVRSLPQPGGGDADVAGRLAAGGERERHVAGVREVGLRVVGDRLLFLEGGVVADVDAEAGGEAEAGRVGEVGWPGGDEADRVERQRRAEV